MSRDYPDRIDVDKAASARRVFRGWIEASRLARLEGLIVAGEPGGFEFELSFSRDSQGQNLAEVDLKGEVAMQCQRTLRTFRQALESHSRVAFVVSENEEAALPEDYEPRVCADQRIELADLIGEEALLALPLVPVDPESDPFPEAPEAKDTHRPFEALAALTKDGDRTD
jgi:uncharacterized protein